MVELKYSFTLNIFIWALFIRASDKSAEIVKDRDCANLSEFLFFLWTLCETLLCDFFIHLARDPTFLDYLYFLRRRYFTCNSKALESILIKRLMSHCTFYTIIYNCGTENTLEKISTRSLPLIVFSLTPRTVHYTTMEHLPKNKTCIVCFNVIWRS